MTKMGISTLQSYRGAQIFEAIGLEPRGHRRLLHLDGVAHRGHRPRRHRRGGAAASRPRLSRSSPALDGDLDLGGQYQWRRRGEHHLYNPNTVAKLQHAVRAGSYKMFKEYTALVNDESRRLLHHPRAAAASSPARRSRSTRSSRRREIVKRFKTGAMSLGSISREAHENLAIAMNRLGGKSNTGEGGEDPVRYVPDANGDLRRSAIKQVASGRFGVTSVLPRQRRRAADQDGAGRQARRGRPAPRPQGRRVHRPHPLLDAGRRPDLAAAAPRHLLDRGPRAAHLRPEELERPGAHQREAGRRGRRRHGRGRRGQGQGRRRADQRLRRRHGRVAAHVDQARRHPVGARPRRDAAGAGAERPARPHPRRDRRPAEDRPRRRDRGAARRRGVRLRVVARSSRRAAS